MRLTLYWLFSFTSFLIHGQVAHGNFWINRSHLDNNVIVSPVKYTLIKKESLKIITSTSLVLSDSICANVCRYYFRNGWINFKIEDNRCYVTHLKKGSEEMYIYLYNGNYREWEELILDVYYEDLEFSPGTFLIDLQQKSCIIKKDRGKNIKILGSSIFIKNRLIQDCRLTIKSLTPIDLVSKEVLKPKKYQAKILELFESN